MILSTNQRLISLGQDYSAGENIGINDRVISSRNWTPDITYAAESAFQRANEYTNTQISALSGEVSSEVSQLGSDIQYISGVALTSHQSLEGYLTKASGDEYYQPIGSYATVSQLESTSGEIVNLIPTDYVSNETLEQTSGNIVNLIPDTSEFITNASAEQTYQPIGNYATQDWVGEQGYLTEISIPESATWQDVSTTVQSNSAQWGQGGGTGGDAEVNTLVHSNSATWNEVSSKLDESTFQEASGLFLTAIPSEYITESDIPNFISAKLDTTSFADVSGTFLTAVDLTPYVPASSIGTKLYDGVNIVSSISGFKISAFVAAYSTFAANADESLTAETAYVAYRDSKNNRITEYYQPKLNIEGLNGTITAINSSAVAGGDPEVNELVYSNSAEWNNVSAKQESLTFGFGTTSGSISSINGSAIIDDYTYHMLNVTRVATENLNKAITANSATWNTVTDKLDTTAFSNVSSDFLVASSLNGYATESLVQDTSANITALIPDTSNFITNASAESTYQTIEGMTAYQPAGSYATTNELEQVSGDITALIPSTAGLASESYVQTNSAVLTGMIDGKQDTLTFGYDEQDRISAINSSALAGGTDIEFGYTDADTISSINTSALTDVSLNNIVQTNSGAWGGSALPITGRDGIDLEIDNGILYIGASALTGYVPQYTFDELKQSYDSLSSLVAAHSASWS